MSGERWEKRDAVASSEGADARADDGVRTPMRRAIGQLMLAYGFTTADIARALDLPPSIVDAMVSGDAPLRRDFVARVTDAFGVAPADRAFLEQAELATPGAVRFERRSAEEARVADAFVRALPRLTSADRAALQEMLVRPDWPAATPRRDEPEGRPARQERTRRGDAA